MENSQENEPKLVDAGQTSTQSPLTPDQIKEVKSWKEDVVDNIEEKKEEKIDEDQQP